MIKYQFTYLLLFLSALLITTSCSQETVAPIPAETEVTTALPSFDPTAVKLTEILQIAGENQWEDKMDFIADLLKPDRSLTPAEIEAVEANLGVSFAEFHRLALELAASAGAYFTALGELNLDNEDLTMVIRHGIAASEPLTLLASQMTDAQGRCLLQDICNTVGIFIVDVIFELFCTFFCEEEVLPWYIWVWEFCEIFSC